MHRYLYAAHSPAVFFDPTGFETFCDGNGECYDDTSRYSMFVYDYNRASRRVDRFIANGSVKLVTGLGEFGVAYSDAYYFHGIYGVSDLAMTTTADSYVAAENRYYVGGRGYGGFSEAVSPYNPVNTTLAGIYDTRVAIERGDDEAIASGILKTTGGVVQTLSTAGDVLSFARSGGFVGKKSAKPGADVDTVAETRGGQRSSARGQAAKQAEEIRARVTANIAQNRAARQASRFDEHVKAERALQGQSSVPATPPASARARAVARGVPATPPASARARRIASGVSNSLPENGLFARVLPRKYAEAFVRGGGNLGGGTEVFATAADDLAGIASRAQAQSRLGLFRDPAGTVPNLEGDAVITFRVKDQGKVGLRSPIETVPERGYGFVPGGRTSGGAREFLFNNGTSRDLGAYDITIRYLK